MIKIIKINILVFFIIILLIEIVLISFNYFFDGVPLYRHFNLDPHQVVSYYQKDYKKKKEKHQIITILENSMVIPNNLILINI